MGELQKIEAPVYKVSPRVFDNGGVHRPVSMRGVRRLLSEVRVVMSSNVANELDELLKDNGIERSTFLFGGLTVEIDNSKDDIRLKAKIDGEWKTVAILCDLFSWGD